MLWQGIFFCLLSVAVCVHGANLGQASIALSSKLPSGDILRPSTSAFTKRGGLRLKGGGSKGTVLVTGGAGYIGTHCTVALHEAGYEV